MKMKTIDKMMYHLSEVGFIVSALGVGYEICRKDQLFFLIYGFMMFVFFGYMTLYIQKYKLLPFWFDLYPKKVKEWALDEEQ